EEVAPAVRRRADEAGQGPLAVLLLAEVVRQADAGQQVARRLLVQELADVLGNEVRVGARRAVALVAPLLVGGAGLALADELERLGAGLAAEGLPLEGGGAR